MEHNNRMFIAVIIAVIIAAAVLSSFLLPLFYGNTPSVELPEISAPVSSEDDPGHEQNPDSGNYVKVEVTPQTVQNVIATLDRPTSYYRELTIETIWGQEESQRSMSEVEVWSDGGFTKTETTLATGLVRHCLIGDETVYLWYGNDKKWYQTKADDFSADLEQHIPTYETVLGLDQSAIVDTGYEAVEDLYCIYVEVQDDLMGYLQRYWVDVQSGLLVYAETVKDGMVVYRMTSQTMEFPIPQDASFTLPDGMVLHEVLQT